MASSRSRRWASSSCRWRKSCCGGSSAPGAPGAAPFTSHLALIFGLVTSTLFHVQADRARAARGAVAELTARMKKPDNADDEELQAFLTEAQELVEGTGGGRKPAPGGAGRD